MNLIENLKAALGSSAINQISEKLGITNEQATSAVNAGIPSTLAGMLKSHTSLSENDFLEGILSNFSDSFFGDDGQNNDGDSWIDKGKSAMGSVFGIETDRVAKALANHSGVNEEKSHGLLAMVVPLVTGAVSKMISSNGWSISDFWTKLWNNKDQITAALPASLSNTLGLANIVPPSVTGDQVETNLVTPPVIETPLPPVTERPVVRNEPVVERPPVIHQEAERKSSSFWTWMIPLLLVALAIWYFTSRNSADKMTVTTDTMTTVVDTTMALANGTLNDAGDYIAELGDTITKKLPDGMEISVGLNSVENKLIAYIEDNSRLVDKDTWFTFDRLFFETGKSTLKQESQKQLNNIAAILKAYPAVELKLGGYTDNTGDAAVNKTISTERAKTALEALVALGVDRSRVEAEGYGPEYPVASNDTEQGRAQNRRIDVRVTNK
jgi:OOP family OmpA-OmpF porin